MSRKAEPELKEIENEMMVAKAAIGKNEPGQWERYATIKDGLSRLIH
jgi:hypothetical protein